MEFWIAGGLGSVLCTWIGISILRDKDLSKSEKVLGIAAVSCIPVMYVIKAIQIILG